MDNYTFRLKPGDDLFESVCAECENRIDQRAWFLLIHPYKCNNLAYSSID